MAEFNAAVSRVCSIFNISSLFDEQKEALKVALGGKSVYASLPTGYGKSMIFYALPIAFDLVNKRQEGSSTVLVISPLQSLMEDQVSYLKSLGLSAVALHEEQSDNILEKVESGKFMYVFASPEKMLSTTKWRRLFDNSSFKKSLIAVVVDEAHCISQWGLSSQGSKIPFRSWYVHIATSF
ncbi:uncharacterized protein LOC110250699 [Exaiptasia diaphana]|uniref:Helicase ATP-binding domain-containing protein n=1 Tax=Exaiptasia diaphana TaxID=2652724 RepID=A0A913Y012_EXADI|nr:uncharacterized protein LOC110250699 [Exaiptasia diaphana]